jgi:hypothetical protein
MNMQEVMDSFEKSEMGLDVKLITNFEELDKINVFNLIKNKLVKFVIFPHEWKKSSNQIISHIKSYDITDRKYHARKCVVKEISLLEMRKFCNLHHIQGANNLGIVSWGIFDGNDLLGILSLGRHHRQSEDVLLDRLCFLPKVRIMGGASKLFSAATKWAMEKGINQIISFSDNRISVGSVYEKMGFKLDRELYPDYFYLEKNNLLKHTSKQSQKKSATNCPSDMTEKQWAFSRGLIQIYDAGKKRWIFKIREPKILKNPLSSRRHGYYETKKAETIYYQSSNELRAATLLDEMPDVEFYTNQVIFYIEGRKRFTDYLVRMKDGSHKIIEVKPERRLAETEIQLQIEDNKKFAAKQGWGFEIWTEKELGFTSEYYLTKWADEFMSTLKPIDFVAIRKERGNTRSKKWYRNNTATDTVNSWCDYCNTTHVVLRKTYEKAIEEKSKWICEAEAGHIGGSRPKPHLQKENPYAAEGKKQCLGRCGQILPFDCFGKDKSRKDGYADRCKVDRRESANDKYKNKTKPPEKDEQNDPT